MSSEIFRVKVEGDSASFTRPEFKTERVSYDVMTPSSARGLVEAILWKPAIRWIITGIDVLKPIQWQSMRRNEVGDIAATPSKKLIETGMGKIEPIYIEDSRMQRAALFLKNVAYVIYARFEMTARAGDEDNPNKFTKIFKRRLANGQCHAQPYLGCREFSAFVSPAQPQDVPSPNILGDDYNRDLGWMLYDIDFERDMKPKFFHAVIQNGHINTQHEETEGPH